MNHKKIDSKKPIEGLKYFRKWNTPDFKGHYHVAQISSKYPIPGIAINDELDHARKKAIDVNRFENEVLQNAIKHKRKKNLKREKAAFSTRVYFNAVIRDPLDEAENVTNDMQEVLDKPPPQGDSMKAILKFYKSIKLGRVNYVSYAVTSGFNSIDWQEPEYGNTSLHHAVSVGNLYR